MVVYTFNTKDGVLRKMKVIGKVPAYDGIRLCLFIDPDTDVRKDKYKKYINCSKNEGEVTYNTFWLDEEDDIKAESIYKNYIKQKLLKEQKRLERVLQKWG